MTQSGNEGDDSEIGPLHLNRDTENGELFFVFLQRGEKRAEGVLFCTRETEWRGGLWGEIRFIRGGEQEQSVISVLTLPLEGRSCCCDKGLVQSNAMRRILIHPIVIGRRQLTLRRWIAPSCCGWGHFFPPFLSICPLSLPLLLSFP